MNRKLRTFLGGGMEDDRQELLARAGRVFSLAGFLGRVLTDASSWEWCAVDRPRLALVVEEFCQSVLVLQDEMTRPPEGFAAVAERLLQAARIAQALRQALAGTGEDDCREYYPELNTVSQAGWAAIQQATQPIAASPPKGDPFAFLNSPAPPIDGPASPAAKPTDAAKPTGAPPRPKKAKRSTERGEARAKLIAALTRHHQYADGGCLNLAPAGNNKLARLAGVSESTASAFFHKEFGGHAGYRAMCHDAPQLIAALKLLNQEFSPYRLFGARPPRPPRETRREE